MNRARLKALLEEKGMNQMDLVRETKLSINTISYACSDPDYNPKLDTLARIAKVLNVKVHELITD